MARGPGSSGLCLPEPEPPRGGLSVETEGDEKRGFDLADSILAEWGPERMRFQDALLQAGDLFTRDDGRLGQAPFARIEEDM